MKILLIPFLAGLFTLASCNSSDCLRGSGKQVSQVRNVDQFSYIEVHGNVKLIVKQGSAQQVRIIADDNVQEEIAAKTKNRRLIIKTERSFCGQTSITVYAASSRLEGIDVSGAVDVITDGPVNSQSFELGMSGASNAKLDIRCGDMVTHTSGDSKLELKGQAGTHNLKMTGASELNAFDFVVGSYNINTSGASDLDINVLNDLNIESSGSSKIKYKGNPKHISNDKSGASSILKVN